MGFFDDLLGGGGGGNQQVSQMLPNYAKTQNKALGKSAFGAARAAAGQPGYEPPMFNPYGGIWGGQGQGANQAFGNMGQSTQAFGQGQGFAPGSYPYVNNTIGGVPQGQQSPNGGDGSVPIVGQVYGGPFQASTRPIELEALMGQELVGRQLGGIGSPVLNLGLQQAGGAFLNAGANPYLQSAIGAAFQPTIQAYQRQLLPALQSQGIQSGAFKGSSAREFAEAQLASDVNQQLMNTASQMAFANYGQERDLQQNSPYLLQQGAGLQGLSPQILSEVGAGQRGIEQRGIQENLMKLQEQIEGPYRPLLQLAQILQGTNPGSMTTQYGPDTNSTASILAGLLSSTPLTPPRPGSGGVMNQFGKGYNGGLIAGLQR